MVLKNVSSSNGDLLPIMLLYITDFYVLKDFKN